MDRLWRRDPDVVSGAEGMSDQIDNLIIASRTLETSGGSPLTVRGLGLPAIVFLVRQHGPALQGFYEKIVSDEMDLANLPGLAAELAEQSVELVAQIIACGVGAPEKWGKLLGLPIGDQVALLEAVGELTFATEGGVKKVVATVARVMAGLNQTMDSLPG